MAAISPNFNIIIIQVLIEYIITVQAMSSLDQSKRKSKGRGERGSRPRVDGFKPGVYSFCPV